MHYERMLNYVSKQDFRKIPDKKLEKIFNILKED
jgi:hypothetical protein